MPLVQAKCTNCGGNLQVNSEKDAAVCQYCNSAFVVEKAINYYNTSNNISAAVVNIYGGSFSDFDVQAGTLKKYTGSAVDVVIPESVIKIGEYREGEYSYGAFQDSLVKSVVIPKSVITIGHHAFCGCKHLKKIDIPESVKEIERNAFSACNELNSIVLPEGVEAIGQSAFSACTNLGSIIIPNTVKSIGGGAFSGCSKLKEITIPASVKKIDVGISTCAYTNIFEGCSSLMAITLPIGIELVESTDYSEHTVLVIPKSMDSLSNEDLETLAHSLRIGHLRSSYNRYGHTHGVSATVNGVKIQALYEKRWKEQGLCCYCGGKVGGIFTKKCNACRKEQPH